MIINLPNSWLWLLYFVSPGEGTIQLGQPVVSTGEGPSAWAECSPTGRLTPPLPPTSTPVQSHHGTESPAATMMKRCWSPWYYYDNTESGSKACAATTIFFSTFSIIYISHCLSGGDSSQFFLPLFETDVDTSKSQSLCCLFALLHSRILFVISPLKKTNAFLMQLLLFYCMLNLKS